jgi:hypothetical protein
MRAVQLEEDGSARVVVEWPPGEHHLRVGIEDPRKEDTGLWVGTVRIPDLSPTGALPTVTESAPAPAPEPDIPEPATTPPPVAEDVIDVPVKAVAASTLAVAPTSKPPVEPAPVPVPENAEPVADEKPVEIEKVEPEAVMVAGSAPEELPIEKTELPLDQPEEDEVIPEVEEDLLTTEREAEPPQIEEPAEVAEEPPLVEPLRSVPPVQTAEPEAAMPRQQTEAAPVALPVVTADVAARYAEWGSADPDIREFSVIVTRGREPVTDVDISAFQLRVGGSQVPVEGLGDARNAPLLLGLAIDVASEEVDDWSGMRGSLSPIVERAGGGRGRLFVATSAGIGAWDAEPEAARRETGTEISDNVARLVIASFERFTGVHGRTFLVVLTDGRNEPAKEEWRKATEVAGEAGVPILVVALWDEDFNNGTRKNLKKLTDVSGGSLFLVQGRSQLDSAADRFGRFLDGGYSLRFRSPGGDRQTVSAISVSTSDKALNVSAPKSIR